MNAGKLGGNYLTKIEIKVSEVRVECIMSHFKFCNPSLEIIDICETRQGKFLQGNTPYSGGIQSVFLGKFITEKFNPKRKYFQNIPPSPELTPEREATR